MQTGYTLFFAIIPILMEECCVKKHHKEAIDQERATTIYRYKVVEGDFFMMQCGNSLEEVVWSKSGEGKDTNERPSTETGRQQEDGVGVLSRDNVLKFPALEANHSGEYTCLTGGRKVVFYVEVLDKSSLGCTKPEESNVILIMGAGGKIACPAFNCSDQASNRNIIWYKNIRAVSELQKYREICEEKGHLCLRTVYDTDTDVYFCDRHTSNQGVVWIYRRAVNATVIPQDTQKGPMITIPQDNHVEEVEIGQSHTLMCKVKFGFERNFSALVQWYTNHHGNKDDKIPIHMESPEDEKRSITEFWVTQKAVIHKVTPLHLNHTYTCFASNAVGNSSATMRLKRKTAVKWPIVVGIPVVFLLLVTGMGVLLRVKWLEVSLIYRSRCQHANNGKDEKEFDVFLSCVWSPLSDEGVGGLTLFSPCGPETDEASPRSMAQLDTDGRCATQRPLEELLPCVLEEQWGYRLFLLERDPLPGGAYTDDVVCALKRSRMLICLLSAEYLCNSNAVFELESGIQALLQDSQFKLLLIRTRETQVSLGQLDPPLPPLVRRALKVLPALDWGSGNSPRTTDNFWRSLRKALPVKTRAASAQSE